MTDSLQTAAPALLDTLIQAGDRVLTPEEANTVQTAVQTLGSGAIDITMPANSILSQLRPFIVDKVGVMAEAFQKLAVDSIEGMDAKYSKETVLTLWPTMTAGMRVLVVFLVLSTVGITGVLEYDTLQQPVVDRMDALLTALIPIGVCIAMIAVPIKTLAYSSLAISAKVVEHKMNKANASAPTQTK